MSLTITSISTNVAIVILFLQKKLADICISSLRSYAFICQLYFNYYFSAALLMFTIPIPMHTSTNAISALIPSSLLPSRSHHADNNTPNTGFVNPKMATFDTGLYLRRIPQIEYATAEMHAR